VAINLDNYPVMIGFAVYAFEGVGIVMPVMQNCKEPEKFPKILAAAIGTLACFYTFFGLVTYLTFGSGLIQPIITEMLPAENSMVIIIKICFCMNLIFSYAIMINPTNAILENWMFPAKASVGRRWARNASRFLVVVSAAVLAVFLADILDKFFGLIGALLCAPLAFMFPAMLHLKIIASTRSEKMIDWLIIFISLGALIFCVTQSVLSW